MTSSLVSSIDDETEATEICAFGYDPGRVWGHARVVSRGAPCTPAGRDWRESRRLGLATHYVVCCWAFAASWSACSHLQRGERGYDGS